MNPNSTHYHSILADYFSGNPLYLDEPAQKKPSTRKLVELPFQQTNGGMWDEVTNTLCDLEFIQAKAAAKMTYDLVRDFNNVLEVIPDNAENINKEAEYKARMDKYALNLIAYAKGEAVKLYIPDSIKPILPLDIDVKIKRIKVNITRLDRIKDFLCFLSREADHLQDYSSIYYNFAIQCAWNYAKGGPVGDASQKSFPEIYNSLLLRAKLFRPQWNPFPSQLKTLKKHSSTVESVSITPDGKRAISGSYDYTCILWDLETGNANHILEGHTGVVSSVSITPDGKRAISGSWDNTCIFWDLEKGQIIRYLKGHTDQVSEVSISADWKRALSSSPDRTCILWDLDTGEKISILYGNNRCFRSVAVTADFKRAFIGSSDSEIVLWDLEKFHETVIQKRSEGVNNAHSIAITPDGKKAI